LALFLIMALGFVVLCIGLFAAGWLQLRQPAWFVEGIGIVGAIFFGACAVFCLVRLVSRRPGLVIDQEGIIDSTSYSSVGRVPWSQITGATVTSLPTFQRSLIFRIPPPRIMVIEVREPQLFLARGNWLQQLLRRGSVGMLGSPVVLPGSVLRADLDDLARRIGSGASSP
jgi:hypothetical protein